MREGPSLGFPKVNPRLSILLTYDLLYTQLLLMFNFRQLTSKIEVAKIAFTTTRGEVAQKRRHVFA
jgi:hypothetical protein